MSGGRIVLINDASVGRGGATGLALFLAELLAERGREVVYLCGDSGEGFSLADKGVQVVPMGGTHLMRQSTLSAMRTGLYNRSAGRNLSRWISEHARPDDVYHLHGWSKILSPAVFKALQPVRSRLVVHAHDYFLACPNGAFWHYGKGEICERVALSAACLSQACDRRNNLQKVWRATRHGLRQGLFAFDATGPRILTIHPGMNAAFIRGGFSADQITTLRNPAVPFLPAPVDCAANDAALFVGRLNPEKGALDFARAAKEIGCHAIIAGEGPEAAAIREANPDAELPGWVDRGQIADLARRARCLVMPSRYPEPFGLVAAEAAGSGLPVLLPDNALLAPEIVDQGAGISYAAGKPDELSAALARIMSGEIDVSAMGQRGRVAFSSIANSAENWVDQHLAVYAALSASVA